MIGVLIKHKPFNSMEKNNLIIQLDNQSSYSNTNNLKNYKISCNSPATICELNQTFLDGSQKLYNSFTDNLGYVGCMSDNNGDFSSYENSITFGDESGAEIPGVTLTFDDNDGTFAKSVTITVTGQDSNYNIITKTLTFHPDSSTYYCNFDGIPGVNQFVVTINNWNTPKRFARITEIEIGKVNTLLLSQLKSVDLVMQTDATGLTIPISKADIIKKAGELTDFAINDEIDIYHNGYLQGVFFVDDISQALNHELTIKCVDLIGKIDKLKFNGSDYTSKDCKDAIDEICQLETEVEKIPHRLNIDFLYPDIDPGGVGPLSPTFNGYVYPDKLKLALRRLLCPVLSTVITKGLKYIDMRSLISDPNVIDTKTELNDSNIISIDNIESICPITSVESNHVNIKPDTSNIKTLYSGIHTSNMTLFFNDPITSYGTTNAEIVSSTAFRAKFHTSEVGGSINGYESEKTDCIIITDNTKQHKEKNKISLNNTYVQLNTFDYLIEQKLMEWSEVSHKREITAYIPSDCPLGYRAKINSGIYQGSGIITKMSYNLNGSKIKAKLVIE